MDPKRKRRRFLVPLLASTAALAGSGWAAVEYGGVGLPIAAAEETPDPSTLDRLEEVWQAEGLANPATTGNRQAAVAKEPTPDPVDPFLNQPPLAAGAFVSAKGAEEAGGPVDGAVVARGQQPAGGAIDIPVDTRLPEGNPLRDGYGAAANPEQQAIARQFGEGRYGEVGTPLPQSSASGARPIRVEIGPESRVQTAAAEADPPPTESTPIVSSFQPDQQAAADAPRYADVKNEDKTLRSQDAPLTNTPSFSNAAPIAPLVQSGAAASGLPLVDVPIIPPTAPSPISSAPAAEPSRYTPPDQPAARLATRQPANASPSPPNSFDPVTPAAPIGEANAFAQPGPSMPPAPRPGDPSLEGRQQPSLAIQKFAPQNVQVGQPCRFMVKIRNDSPRSLADVVVNDHTPAGARLVSTQPTAQTSGDAVRWLIGTLGPGEERTLEMEVIPNEEGEIGSVATVSFAAQASVKTSVTRPLLALRLSAPAQVMVGQEQRMQIEIRNPGSGDATGVVLSENVPANLRHEAGSSVEFEIGTLRAGETRRLELVMNAEAPGPVSNVLVARADGDLEVRQQVDFEVVAPQLSVAVQGPKRRFLQRPATYTVRLDNPGTAAARDIRLVARLPRGMQFVKANNLGEYDQSTHSVYWALAELPQGEGGEVQVTALPTRAGEMTIEAEGQAGDGLQDQSVHQVKIEGVAAVDFQVLDVEDPIEVGGQTEYEVRVNNQGTAEATGVRVRFVAPPGMRVLSANGPTRHAIDSRGVAFDPLPRLAPRAENRYRIRVQADEAGDQRMMVEVTTDDLKQPVRKEEATRVFGDE